MDKSIDKFNFDILLRDKFPFQPPLILTRTKVKIKLDFTLYYSLETTL